MLKKRLKQMQEAKTLPDFENLYFDIAGDIGMLNDYLTDHLVDIQVKKKEIKETNPKISVAGLEREFEMTAEYREHKTWKYWIDGASKMMAGVRVKIESLRAENKGQY